MKKQEFRLTARDPDMATLTLSETMVLQTAGIPLSEASPRLCEMARVALERHRNIHEAANELLRMLAFKDMH